MGADWGSIAIGPPILVMEGRIRASRSRPSMDIVNYAPRIRVPTLINGRYDSVLPYELSQVRLFDLLGTPAADKRHVLLKHQSLHVPRTLSSEVNDCVPTNISGP